MAETQRLARNGKVTLTLLSTEETDKAEVWLSNRTQHSPCVVLIPHQHHIANERGQEEVRGS